MIPYSVKYPLPHWKNRVHHLQHLLECHYHIVITLGDCSPEIYKYHPSDIKYPYQNWSQIQHRSFFSSILRMPSVRAVPFFFLNSNIFYKVPLDLYLFVFDSNLVPCISLHQNYSLALVALVIRGFTCFNFLSEL